MGQYLPYVCKPYKGCEVRIREITRKIFDRFEPFKNEFKKRACNKIYVKIKLVHIFEYMLMLHI